MAELLRLHCRSVNWLATSAVALLAVSAPALAADDTQRSFKAEVLFRLANPCPGTGQTHGPCKGYVIDRVIPLVCGGADAPSNMQWQTIAEAKEKDRWEKIGCRPGRSLVLPGPPTPAEAYPLQEHTAPTDVQPLPIE